MKSYLILLLLTSIALVIMSAWSLNTFRRLKKAEQQHSTNEDLLDSCHVSKQYVESGKWVAIVMLTVSLMILIMNSVEIFIQSCK